MKFLQHNLFMILALLLFLGCMQLILLWLHVPLLLAAPLALMCWYIFYKKYKQHLPAPSLTYLIAVSVGLFIMLQHWNAHITPFGGWDSWSMWSVNGKYLQSQDSWTQAIIPNKHAHGEYPLLLPAILGSFIQYFPQYFTAILYSVHALIFVLLLGILATYLWQRNKVLCVIALYVLCSNNAFINETAAYYADTLLALLLLGIHIILNSIQDKDKSNSLLLGILMGALLSTKQEGLLLLLLLLPFYKRIWFSHVLVLNCFLGLAPFLILWILQKVCYPVSSDMSSSNVAQLLNVDRWRAVYLFFKEQLWPNNRWLLGLCALGLLGVLRKSSRPVALSMAASVVAYYCIYVVTPHDIQWHLSTSANRLLHQLIPSCLLCFTIAMNKLQPDELAASVNDNFSQ